MRHEAAGRAIGRSFRATAIAAAASVVLSGCGLATPQATGAALGGAAGALAGSLVGGGNGRIVGAGAGATLGATAGAAIGGWLDGPDSPPSKRAAPGAASAEEEAAFHRGRADYLQEQRALREQEAYRRGRLGLPWR